MISSGKLDPKLDPKTLVGDTISLAEAPAALMNMDKFQSVGATVRDSLGEGVGSAQS